jgi:hypothetical protein
MTSSGPPSWLSTAVPPPTSSTLGPNTIQSQETQRRALPLGAIIGIVVGGVALIAFTIFILTYLRKRRNNRNTHDTLQPYGLPDSNMAAKPNPPLRYHSSITPFQPSNDASSSASNAELKRTGSNSLTRSSTTNKTTSKGISSSNDTSSTSTTSRTGEKRTQRTQNRIVPQPPAPLHSEKRRIQQPEPRTDSTSQNNANNAVVTSQSRDEKIQLNRTLLAQAATSRPSNAESRTFRTIEPADRYR